MRVTLLRDPGVFSANIVVGYAVGGRDEPAGESGYTHFVEHLMFQGTRRIRNWFRMIGAMGAHTNAFTYRDHTLYTQTLPKDLLELAISLEAERMVNLEVTAEKVEREKGTILEEKAGRENRPYTAGWDRLTRLIFSNHRNRSDVIGSEEDIRAATPEKLRRYLDAYYTADRANVVISGNIDLDQAETWARRYLGAVPARSPQAGDASAVDLREEVQRRRREAELEDPYASAPAVLFGWQAPGYGTPDYYDAGILALLLQERLHRELIMERKSAVGVSLALPYLERDPVAIQGSITLGSQAAPEEALGSLENHIAAIRRGEFTPEELERAIERQVHWAFSELQGSDRATLFALAAVRGIGVDALERDMSRWRQVTVGRVRAAAERYLAAEKTSVVTVRPAAAAAAPEARRPHSHQHAIDESPTADEAELLNQLAGYEWAPLRYAPPTEFALANGLKIVVLPDGRVPTVHAKLAFRLGSTAADGDARQKVPFASQLLRLKTMFTSESGIEELLDRIGGTLHATQKWDHAVFDGNAPADRGLELLRLMGEVVTRPHEWTEEELAPWKAWWKDSLRQSAADPATASHQRAVQDLLGNHPSARATLTPEAVDALTPQEFSRLIRSHFAPDNAVLVVAGNVDPERVRESVSPIFQDWRPSTEPRRLGPEASIRPQRAVSLIDRPESEQSLIRLSAIGIDAGRQSSPDFFPMIVADRILGNGFGSRLFQVIRQSLGMAYNAFSSVVTDPAVAMWTFGLYTRPEKTGPALDALLDQAERMRSEQPSSWELGSAKNALIGAFLLSLDRVGDIADHILGRELFGLPLAEWGLYPSKVSQVTGDAVQRLAVKLLDPEHLAVTVVGDAEAVREDLSAIRPVREFDQDGRPKAAPKPGRGWLSFLKR